MQTQSLDECISTTLPPVKDKPSLNERRLTRDRTPPSLNKWYVICCNPGLEKRSAEYLTQLGFRIYLPISAREVKTGRRHIPVVREMPAFSRYLFAATLDFTFAWHKLEGVFGIESTLRMNGEHVAIPHIIMQEVMSLEAAGFYDNVPTPVRKLSDIGLQSGDAVTILEGAFANLPAKIMEIVGGAKARLLIKIFNTENTAIIPLAQVEALR